MTAGDPEHERGEEPPGAADAPNTLDPPDPPDTLGRPNASNGHEAPDTPNASNGHEAPDTPNASNGHGAPHPPGFPDPPGASDATPTRSVAAGDAPADTTEPSRSGAAVDTDPATAGDAVTDPSGRVTTVVGAADERDGNAGATSDGDDSHDPHLRGHSDSSPPPPPPPPEPSPRAGAVPSASAYRSTDERNRSVYRRANPWYRRLARGLIALGFIGVLAVGVYLGARAIQDYINRDQLPATGPDVPTIRTTTILLASTSNELELQGTLSFDTESGAYEFTGLAGSPNAQDRVTSPDGVQVYVLNADATWSLAAGDEPIVGTVERAIAVLADDTTADAILTNRIRRGYVDLIAETEEGPESDRLTRYDVALDLTGFAANFPLQWNDYREDGIPGATESRRHETSIWLDDRSVLVRVQDVDTGWNWERLAYSDEELVPFRPPPTQVIDPETREAATGIDCSIDALDVGWSTTLPSCDDSQTVGRQLAASVGLADSADAPAAELAFASVCSTLQGGEPQTFDDAAYLELAGLLVDAGVCPGDTSLVRLADE